MKIFGFDLTFAYECIQDVYNLLSAYKQMSDKRELRKASKNAENAEVVEEKEEEKKEEVEGVL